MKYRTQLTTPLLLPLLEFNKSFLSAYKVKAYLGYYPDTGKEWGKNMYLITGNISSEDLEKFTFHEWFDTILSGDMGSVFKYNIPEHIQQTIIKPFLLGKYSEVDREFVDNNFSETFFQKKEDSKFAIVPSLNWMIFNKSKGLREKWENFLDVTIDKNAELWDPPKKEREILLYQSDADEYVKEGSFETAGS